MSAIEAYAAAAGTGVDPESRGVQVGEPGGEMGKDQFMQLLVVQMQNQDPLDPVDNKELIAQLAQFSALEQMQNLNTRFELFKENTLGAIASSLIGRQVTVEEPGGVASGKVQSLAIDGDTVLARLDTGGEYDLKSLTLVEDGTGGAAAVATGDTVSGLNFNFWE
jgi:flagellar basal-body rod modification protein FlgD